VCGKLAEKLTERQFTVSVIGEVGAAELQKVIADANLAAATLRSGRTHDRAEQLSRLLERVDLYEDRIEVTPDVDGLQQLFRMSNRLDIETPAIVIEAVRVRRGHQLRLIVPGPASGLPKPARRNDKLVALVAEARRARELVLAKPEQTIASIAKEQGRCRTRLTRLVTLSCLAPDIVTAIVQGKQPEHLTANRRSASPDSPNCSHEFSNRDGGRKWRPKLACRTRLSLQIGKMPLANAAELRPFGRQLARLTEFRSHSGLSGAVEKTRTSTGFRPQRPQRCASTSSATTA
jgi:hypothetical protein